MLGVHKLNCRVTRNSMSSGKNISVLGEIYTVNEIAHF